MESWLLMRSPVPSIVICVLYLVAVATGPGIMRNRSPLNLKWILVPYNFVLIVLSGYMFYEVRAGSYLQLPLHLICI